jgi:hypothetical protein
MILSCIPVRRHDLSFLRRNAEHVKESGGGGKKPSKKRYEEESSRWGMAKRRCEVVYYI